MSGTIWLLDRSRVVDGRGFCPRARLLGYHIGPSGMGIAMKGTKLPLMTGIIAHAGLAPILQWCADHADEIVQALQLPEANDPAQTILPVPTAIVRSAVQLAQQQYWKTVEARGFAYLENDEGVKEVTREQCYLIEGLIWSWCLEVLPDVLRRGRIIEVEHDDTYVFGCTCGLSDGVGSLVDHEARACSGFGLQCRPDFLLETYLTKELEYHEFKTTGMDSPTFRDQWEVQIQMFAATLDAERRHGKHVQSIYVHGLIKGKREGEYNRDTGKKDGVYRQQSVFCYGYRREGNPPMEQEEWLPEYEWFDPFEQRNRRVSNKHKKTGVWELPDAWIEPGMSKGEWWVRQLPPESRRKRLVVLGPFSRQTQMVEHFLEETKGEETRWQAGLWELYDVGMGVIEEAYPEGLPEGADTQAIWWELVWPDARFQQAMDRLFPRSYQCRRYGKRNRCQFEGPCLKYEGWADPVVSGRYIERRPHHRDELEQAISRGLVLPEEGVAEEEEEREL